MTNRKEWWDAEQLGDELFVSQDLSSCSNSTNDPDWNLKAATDSSETDSELEPEASLTVRSSAKLSPTELNEPGSSSATFKKSSEVKDN